MKNVANILHAGRYGDEHYTEGRLGIFEEPQEMDYNAASHDQPDWNRETTPLPTISDSRRLEDAPTEQFNMPAVTPDDEGPLLPQPSDKRNFLEAAKDVAASTFRAPGYLSRKLDEKLGDLYAKVRYSDKVNAAVNKVTANPTEHGVVTPTAFLAVGKLAA